MKPIIITIAFLAIFSLAKGQQSDSAYRKLFTPVNREARYRGGDSAFLKFFLKNFKYPKTGENYSGKVIIEFVIEKDGSLSDIHISQKITPELSTEIIRVMKLSPKWSPRIEDGRPRELPGRSQSILNQE